MIVFFTHGGAPNTLRCTYARCVLNSHTRAGTENALPRTTPHALQTHRFVTAATTSPPRHHIPGEGLLGPVRAPGYCCHLKGADFELGVGYRTPQGNKKRIAIWRGSADGRQKTIEEMEACVHREQKPDTRREVLLPLTVWFTLVAASTLQDRQLAAEHAGTA